MTKIHKEYSLLISSLQKNSKPNLYLLSDYNKIDVGDWFYYKHFGEDIIDVAKPTTDLKNLNSPDNYFKRIITTTDASMEFEHKHGKMSESFILEALEFNKNEEGLLKVLVSITRNSPNGNCNCFKFCNGEDKLEDGMSCKLVVDLVDLDENGFILAALADVFLLSQIEPMLEELTSKGKAKLLNKLSHSIDVDDTRDLLNKLLNETSTLTS